MEKKIKKKVEIKKHKGGRTKQFHVRLTEAELSEVKAKVKADGYKSEADWLMAQPNKACSGRRQRCGTNGLAFSRRPLTQAVGRLRPKGCSMSNGRYCDNCETHLNDEDYVSYGSWSYTCHDCGFVYRHSSELSASDDRQNCNVSTLDFVYTK